MTPDLHGSIRQYMARKFRGSNCVSDYLSGIAQPRVLNQRSQWLRARLYPDAAKITCLAPCTLFGRLVQIRVARNVCYQILTEQERL
jgi:hypothetical protein